MSTAQETAGTGSAAGWASLVRLATQPQPLTAAERARVGQLVARQQEMSDRLIAQFQRNLAAFAQYLPDVARQFTHYRPQHTLEFFCLDDGVANVQFGPRQEVFYKTADIAAFVRRQVEDFLDTQQVKLTRYNREYDWCGEIHYRYLNRIVSIYQEQVAAGKTERLTARRLGALANCVILGVGLGYQLPELYSRVEIANTVMIEPEQDLFFASLHTLDWADLLRYFHENHYGINLIVGTSKTELLFDLGRFYERHGRFQAGFWYLFPDYASPAIAELAEVFAADNGLIFSCMGFFDDHMIGMSQGIKNLAAGRHFVTARALPPDVAEWPVFVVGNGPSLDHDLPFLRACQDKAVIIACGTAVDTLYHAGIAADFYACTERTPQIADSLKTIPDADYLKRLILLAGDVCHPRVAACFAHTALFLKGDEPLFTLLCAQFRETAAFKFIYLMNPLVGNMGLASAYTLGFRRVFLFGIDNGRRAERTQMHSQYATLYTLHGVRDQGGNFALGATVPANFGGECHTGPYYDISRQNLSKLIEQKRRDDPTLECYNCSDGVLIAGAEPRHSEDLAFAAMPDLDKSRLRGLMTHTLTAPLPFSAAQITAVLAKEVFARFLRAIADVFACRPTTRIAFTQAMVTASEILSRISASKQAFMADTQLGTMQSVFMMVTGVLYAMADEREAVRTANLMIDQYLHFLTDAEEIYAYLPEYVMGDHQRFLHGKVGRDYPDSQAPDIPPFWVLLREVKPDPMTKFVKRYR